MHAITDPDTDQPLVSRDPEVLSGMPVFPNTRVPVEILFDYVVDGKSLDEFLDGYPSVSRDQAIALLRHLGTVATDEAAP